MITETPSLHPADADARPDLPGPDAAEGLALRANKLDLLERLADDLAHEIKNPLHSMVINLEVLKRRVARADSADEVQRYIGVLAGELERVNRRIELLLRLSRPGRGAENTTLSELTEEVMELIQLEARHADVQVDYRAEGGMARVYVPREPSRQVILNLVLEVLDHTERGATLRIRVAEQGGESRLAVADSGGTVAALAGGDSTRLAAAHALAATVGGRVEAEEDQGAPALVFALPLARA
ncbi:MAG TPA: HAMP domain-containing sensor histidine kinase [Longimicrobium sp.]